MTRKSPGEGGGEGGPSQSRPSLRDMHSPQPHAKSTMEDDSRRHNAPDSPPHPRRHKDKVAPPPPLVTRCPRNPRWMEQATNLSSVIGGKYLNSAFLSLFFYCFIISIF